MTTETEMAPNRDIDQVLNQTEVGHWIARHKNSFIALIVIIIAGIFGWGGYNQVQGKKEQALGDKIYQFQEAAYTQLIDKKITPADYLTQFKALQLEVGDFEGFAPLVVKSASHLMEQDAKKEAIEILEGGLKNLKTPLLTNIISIHLAAALEDLKMYPRAIEVLENLNTSSLKLMEDKIYLDLGRLYLTTGNTDKAKVNLQYLVDNGKDAEFIKIAKLYLEDLN